MSANPKLHPVFTEILKRIEQPLKPARFARQQMLENEIAMFAPDFNEAMELLDALECGVAAKMSPDGDALPVDVQHRFLKLREALDEADRLHQQSSYDPTDQYAGPEDEERE